VFSLVEVSVTPRNFKNSLVVMVFLFAPTPIKFINYNNPLGVKNIQRFNYQNTEIVKSSTKN